MSAEATAATVAVAPAPELPTHESTSPPLGDQPHRVDDGHPNCVHPDAKAAHGPGGYAEPRASPKPIGLHSPPDSNGAMKLDGSDGSDDSELSDIEDPTLEPGQPPFFSAPSVQPETQPAPQDEDIGEVTPDHWSGTVPVFKPDMHQFKDFKKFMEKIDSYGMKSGIVKIIPPQEWRDQLPALDDLVKQIRVREPIKQEIMGSNGTYRQVNILHQRAYNLPQWRQLCDQSEHQPPARRGERRAQAPPKPKGTPVSTPSGAKRRGAGVGTSSRSTRSKTKKGGAKGGSTELDERPMTPVSPRSAEAVIDSVEQDIGDAIEDDDPIPSIIGRMGGSRQAKPKEQSTSARRKFARREGSAKIDEEAFKHFDYKMDISDYTPERCEELERIYWKTLTYAPPLYGADVLGTLFDDSTENWNLNKLPNLLDVLGTKVPGVNTAYLYLGMWKATFAWHLEDVDLYSINYLHFGAPKQWYSISQGDARRFEAAMKSIWPTDAKACGQFLRHKAFLISPNHLQQYFNIKVNKCVSYPGEFVVTYPYGYHSGYNLGYNCAEAVNFALDSWLSMGRIAKKCECAQAQDSVWVDVYEIERKLRGEETDYEETEDDDDDDDEDEDDEDEPETGMPTPLSTHALKFKSSGRKRKRTATAKGEKKAKKIRLRLKSQVEPPCCLCPHDIPGFELLPTDDDRKAHRLCALYGTETWIEMVDGKEVVANTANISKDRLDLKCLFCRSKRGACFQCSHKKCARSYHATCAAAAGVFVEEADVPVFSEDGTEYKEQAFEFSCRFHRAKRDRKLDGDTLDDCQKTRRAASALKKGDICQFQYHRGDIFAGIVVENRDSEQTLLIDILPNGDRLDVEWKWLLLPDPADLHLPHASQNAIPMPTSRRARELVNATRKRFEELPRPEEPFVEGGFVWAEFNHHDLETNKAQAKVDLSKENQVWYYLGKRSTEARPQYTEDPRKKQHNCKSNFLDSLPRPAPLSHPPRKPYGSTFSIHTPIPVPKSDKPYQYKPRDPLPPSYIRTPFTAHQFVPNPSPYTAQQFEPKPTPNAFFHHTQPMTRPLNYSTPPQPAPLPSPQTYYKFQHTPYIPPGQQAQHFQRAPQVQPAQPASQQRPPQTPQKAPPHSVFDINQSNQQPPQLRDDAPQTGPYFPVQSAYPAQQPQLPVLQPSTGSAPQAGTQAVCTPNALAKQQSESRRSSLSRPPPTPTGNGHTRSKSSISSHSGRLTLGSGQRFGTPPSSYGHARVDSITKSPFSHGFTQPPGLGPSPSPQNSQLFQTQARARSSSLVSNISLNAPMTSSAIRPSSSTTAQALAGQLQSVMSSNLPMDPRPSVIQKYAFFQVHHNRDSTKYRTPYAHWGGFTNGYEGNLRAHLMRTPDALFGVRTQSIGLNGTNPGPSPTAHKSAMATLPPTNAASGASTQSRSPIAYDRPALSPATAPSTAAALASSPTMQQAPPSAAQSSMVREPSNWQSNLVGNSNGWGVNDHVGATLHPAIRSHYAAMLQNRNVKVETQSDTSSTAHPLAMIPPLPAASPGSCSGTPLTPATQGPGLPSTSPFSPFGPKHGLQSKSTTPIPPPILPAVSTPSQGTAVHVTSVKTVPKKTHIPAPRPWETLRKMQASSRPAVSQPSQAAAKTTAPHAAPTTPSPQPLPVYTQLESYRHIPNPGFQPNHVVQSPSFRVSAVHPPRPAVAQAPKFVAPHESPLTDLIRSHSPAMIPGGGLRPIPAPTMSCPAPPGHGSGTPDLPEVSDGSMELVESIIRNAQKASESFFGLG
ncbi:hypothetical protein SAMD00023353_3300560 [Rosellinia necatrix]|uniref:[histone H3]-trimethyl-L-lysine(9) demethylase n=1 Tax=Rosellinia necatrix TaxID=77044 RepID=A0A1W2TK74_ROSNE|nr:hypothetical protein SAMD00023353_3300560 [Rosellinia necatrix]